MPRRRPLALSAFRAGVLCCWNGARTERRPPLLACPLDSSPAPLVRLSALAAPSTNGCCQRSHARVLWAMPSSQRSSALCSPVPRGHQSQSVSVPQPPQEGQRRGTDDGGREWEGRFSVGLTLTWLGRWQGCYCAGGGVGMEHVVSNSSKMPSKVACWAGLRWYTATDCAEGGGTGE